jgi:hypothetical protein
MRQLCDILDFETAIAFDENRFDFGTLPKSSRSDLCQRLSEDDRRGSDIRLVERPSTDR